MIILLKALPRKSFTILIKIQKGVAIDRSEQKVCSETQSLSAPAVIEKLQIESQSSGPRVNGKNSIEFQAPPIIAKNCI